MTISRRRRGLQGFQVGRILAVGAFVFSVQTACTLELYDQRPPASPCGNAVLDPGEQCDDGNHGAGDGCSPTCTLEFCGNGRLDPGEECDIAASTFCNPGCKVSRCGDGYVNTAAGEVCDDGNMRSGDGCSADCRSTELCGNSLLDPGEACDDGNTRSGDGCSADCRSIELCGNGIVDLGETCDTAGASAGCDPDCTLPLCGDGLLNVLAGEQCDDGNLTNGDGCERNCTRSP